jgi:glutamate formiminotransferase/formiminotetrahydrofolate cyclodeaminase
MNLAGLTLDQFLRLVASDAPAPGGGSVAALAAALSASLCAMVARLTTGREKYRDSWESMETVREAADVLASTFLSLVEKDTEAYNAVIAAFRLPRENDAQKSFRQQAIESATRQAAAVPLTTLEHLSRVPDLVREALERGNPNCMTDAGVALQLVRAGAAGAAYNVRINLPGIKDRELAETMLARTGELLAELEEALAPLERIVQQRLGP